MPTTHPELTSEQTEALGRELDALRNRVVSELGERDAGYGILRMSEDQPWRRRDLANPVYALVLALLFQWGVAVHDLEVERIEAGEIELSDKRDILSAIWRKGRRQVLKDYAVFPL